MFAIVPIIHPVVRIIIDVPIGIIIVVVIGNPAGGVGFPGATCQCEQACGSQ